MAENRLIKHSDGVAEARLGVARNITEVEIDGLLSGCEATQDLFSSYVIDRGPSGELIVRSVRLSHINEAGLTRL